jgi:hypothetical protein
VNYLGRGWASCVMGLRDYHRSVLRTRLAARADVDPWHARELLQHLLFDLEVDVAARGGAAGLERMTEVERAVFYPAVRRLRGALGTISIADAPSSWAAALASARSILREAIRDLRAWQPPALRAPVAARGRS